jgi:hypothetical protein
MTWLAKAILAVSLATITDRRKAWAGILESRGMLSGGEKFGRTERTTIQLTLGASARIR